MTMDIVLMATFALLLVAGTVIGLAGRTESPRLQRVVARRDALGAMARVEARVTHRVDDPLPTWGPRPVPGDTPSGRSR